MEGLTPDDQAMIFKMASAILVRKSQEIERHVEHETLTGITSQEHQMRLTELWDLRERYLFIIAEIEDLGLTIPF